MSREKLEALERLQQVEIQIENLSKEADAIPARLSELESLVARARVAADLERGKVADAERARRQVENQLGDDKEKIKKWEQRLPQLKHPREFQALQREVDNLRRATTDAETQIGALKTSEESTKAALRTKESDVNAKEAGLAAEASSLRGKESELRAQVANLQGNRAELRAKVDPALLAQFDGVRKRRPGKALVPVANGTCTACNRRVAPQLLNKLHGGEVGPCGACQRLIYIPASAA